MRIKKFISGLLVAGLLVGLMPTTLAAGNPTVSISSGEVVAGESVTLTVSIKDNPGLAACKIYVYYDTSVFTVLPNKDMQAAGVFKSSGMLLANTIEAAKQSNRYDGNARKDGVLGLWYNATGMNTTGDGALMTVTFHVNDDAVNGTYKIGLDCSEDDTCNQNSEAVKISASSGSIVVSGGKQATTQQPYEEEDEAEDSEEINEEIIKIEFPDVKGHWAQEYIEKAAAKGLVNGYETGNFLPDRTMTRAECVTLLWRAYGSPKATKSAGFTDLSPTQTWYHEAVNWAAENGVVNGVGDNKFDPTGTITREMVATILHRLAGSPTGMEIMLGGVYDAQFKDSSNISKWSKSSVYWSIFNVVYCDVDSVQLEDMLYPRENASRAQIAVMLIQFMELN